MPELSEQNKRIVEMWNAGVSGGDIAREFNTTRSAILGRIHRMRSLGVELREQNQNKEINGGIDILELGYVSCRYVLNNSHPYRYCGKEIKQKSYCEEHYHLCYYL